MSPTAARTTPTTGAHYYDPKTGEPRHFVPKKDGSGNRPSTIRDARENGWLPSCTTILKLLHKEALVQWMVEQACLSLITSPRQPGEKDDAFVYRILHEEKVQEQESQIARDKGTAIHAALEAYFTGLPVPPDMEVYVRPLIENLIARGQVGSAEVTLIGEGYAGKTDLIQDCPEYWHMVDFKSSKKLPDPNKGGAYPEHRLQLSAYAKAWSEKLKRAGKLDKPIVVSNAYISTTNPGEFIVIEHEQPWEETFEKGFRPLLVHWMWANNYWPVQPTLIDIPQPHTLAQAAAQESVEVANMRAHYIAANARVEELEKRLSAQSAPVEVTIDAPALLEHLKDPDFRARAAAAGWDVKELKAAAEKAMPVATQAAPVPGAIPTNTNLPTHTPDGKKLQWTTATASGPVPPKK